MNAKGVCEWMALAVGLAFPLAAEVRTAAIFTDRMVLQADQPVPVWGKAAPGETVRVSFRGETCQTQADPAGNWRVALPSGGYLREGTTLTVEGANRILFRDVLVGEVWLGAGQSNMDYPLDLCEEGKRIAKGGVLPETIRYFRVPKDGDVMPRSPFDLPEGCRWLTYTPENQRASNQSSMLLAFFAKRLHEELGDVPIGVIGIGVGGANLESWMSRETIIAAGTEREAAELMRRCETWHRNDILRWEKRPERERFLPFPRINFESRPSQAWNAMIAPIRPYRVRGFLWYQGEMNSGWQLYLKQFPFFAASVREAFENPALPLFIVQLPDYREEHWVRIRNVQRILSGTIPHTGLAVTIDGQEMELHPRDKTKVADRLVRLALADCYGRKVVARSPTPVKAVVEGRRVTVTFRDVGERLSLTDGTAPRTFEVVGGNGKGAPVPAEIRSADTVWLTLPDGVSNPKAVRYAWSPDPDVNLVNSGGLPASPFEIEIEK